MADSSHVTAFQAGPAAILAIGTPLDLSNADLSGVVLTGADLGQSDLSGANLGGASITNTDLSQANLSTANLTNTNFSGCTMIVTDFSGATATAGGPDFTSCNLQEAVFSAAQLPGVNFSLANLDLSDFTGALVRGGNFVTADLGRALFSGTQGILFPPSVQTYEVTCYAQVGADLLYWLGYDEKFSLLPAARITLNSGTGVSYTTDQIERCIWALNWLEQSSEAADWLASEIAAWSA